MQDVVKKIEFHVRPIVENLNFELWGIDVLSGAQQTVRIFLENAGIDECTQVSRLVGLVLDVEEIFSSPWVLEVSTPGLDRMFFDLSQMQDYLGEVLSVSLHNPMKNAQSVARKKIEGKLIKIHEAGFEILQQDSTESIEINWNNVKKVKVVPQFEMPQKHTSKKKNNEE